MREENKQNNKSSFWFYLQNGASKSQILSLNGLSSQETATEKEYGSTNQTCFIHEYGSFYNSGE